MHKCFPMYSFFPKTQQRTRYYNDETELKTERSEDRRLFPELFNMSKAGSKLCHVAACRWFKRKRMHKPDGGNTEYSVNLGYKYVHAG